MAAGDGCSAMALRAAGFTPAGPQANEPLLYASTLCDGGRAMVARRGETPPLVCTASEPLRAGTRRYDPPALRRRGRKQMSRCFASGFSMVARRGETPPLVCTASEPLRAAGFMPAGPAAFAGTRARSAVWGQVPKCGAASSGSSRGWG